MRKFSTLLLAAGAVALAGTAALAAANDVHHMKVRLADGSVANIVYTGDVAPKVSITPEAPGFIGFGPQIALGPQFAFPDFARMQAVMDRQMAAAMAQMHQQVQMMNAMLHDPGFATKPNGPISAAFGSAGGSGNFCARSVSITTDASGKQHVERHQAGNCGSAPAHGAAPQRAPLQLHGGTSI